MTTNPEFDPARAAAMKRMLMDAVENTAPGIRKQIALLLSLCIAGVVLAGGATAWALNTGILVVPVAAPVATHSAAATPAPVSTPTSTSTPVVPGDSGVPLPRVPVSCSDLASPDSIAALFSGGTPVSPGFNFTPGYRPEYAAFQQAGVLNCGWERDGTTVSNLLTLYIATDPVSGRSDITAQQSAGQGSLGVGDISSFECQKVVAGCTASIVSGNYWLALEYQGDETPYSVAPQKMAAIAQRMLAVLKQHPNPASAWTMPANSWVPVAGCSALMTNERASTLMETPGLSLIDLKRGSMNGIWWTLPDLYRCSWRVSDGATVPTGQTGSISAEIAPGAKWAYEQVTSGSAKGVIGSKVSVAGAEDAKIECQSAEGDKCWLDVLSSNSWLQVGFGDDIPPSDQSKLIRVAESIIASRH
jgi:hypothetical protein